MFRSYAQNLEDVVLWRVLGHVENGAYVDVGAADPDHDSVTRAFYERGWSGVNVEPVSEYVDRLRAERPRDVTIAACAGSQTGLVELATVVDTGLSSLANEVALDLARDGYAIERREVRVEPLDVLLDEVGYGGRSIHFAKIDVEGFEDEVIRGFDLGRWRPWVLVVEATHPRTGRWTHDAWEPMVLDAGYRACLFDGLNRFYVAPDHLDIAERLSYPACVLDQPFVSSAHGELLSLYQDLEASTMRLQAELERTVADHAHFEQEYDAALEAYRRLSDEHAALHGRHSDLLASFETLRQGVREMNAEVEALRSSAARAAAAERAMAELTASTSWKITAPVRRVLDTARRRR